MQAWRGVEVLGDVEPELFEALVDRFELAVVAKQGGVELHRRNAGVGEGSAQRAGGGRKK